MRIDLYFKNEEAGMKVIHHEINYRMASGMDLYFGVEEVIDLLSQVTEYRTFVNGKEVYGYYDGFSNYGWNIEKTGLLEVDFAHIDGELWYSVVICVPKNKYWRSYP